VRRRGGPEGRLEADLTSQAIRARDAGRGSDGLRTEKMPAFSLDAYGTLLEDLRSVGYAFETIGKSEAPCSAGETFYLRHDVDLHLCGIEQMAVLEAEHGVCATYYVPLTLHFNVLYPENYQILHQIRDCGHEIGLHYDAATYPTDVEAARRHLEWECGILEAASGGAVHTVCMHNPHTGQADPFRESREYANPDSSRFRRDCLYVSDSCRVWRDESLLRCFGGNPPHKVLLNTHPELWLRGEISRPLEYVDRVLRTAGVQQNVEYFDSIRELWVAHEARRSRACQTGTDVRGREEEE
jgi:hypothetical protein